MLESYLYLDGKFHHHEMDLGICPKGMEWEDHLRTLGWKFVTLLPQHQEREYSTVQAFVYMTEEQTSCLIELLFHESVQLYIVCPSKLQFFQCLKDFIYPLVAQSDRETWMAVLINARHCLFDEDFGLKCAQRMGKHEREMWALRREKEVEKERLKA